jgi:hypothetical protein
MTDMVISLVNRLRKLPLELQIIFIEDIYETAQQRLTLFEKIVGKRYEQ